MKHSLASSLASLIRIAAVIGLAAAALTSRATSVIPPTFPDLVKQSDYVIRGVVKSVSAEMVNDATGRHIVTSVEIDVRQVIAGTPPAHVVLTMLGGTVGALTQTVHGAPKFSVGDDDILFVAGNGKNFSPLVALMHGRYPILSDSTGRQFVARNNGVPLYSENDVSLPIGTPSPVKAEQANAQPLSPAAFIGKIQSAYNQSHRPTLEN
ncbi:MAG TPA: hypothetical protein VHD32_05420 [Candidatus Didemnitutus sp.]|nr:hypothetical protein [Candidatus Didemnitutus sp.]